MFARVTRVFRSIAAASLLLVAVSARASNPEASISVRADQVVLKVSRYLTGACLEDIQHEIYPGLYSQMLFGESFQEPPPAEPLKGMKIIPINYGAWYVGPDGAIRMDELAEPSFVACADAEFGSGSTGVEMLIQPGGQERAGLLVKISEPNQRLNQFNAYFVCFDAKGQMSLRGFGKLEPPAQQIPVQMPVGKWFSLAVKAGEKSLEISVDGKSVLAFHDTRRPASRGMVGLATPTARSHAGR